MASSAQRRGSDDSLANQGTDPVKPRCHAAYHNDPPLPTIRQEFLESVREAVETSVSGPDDGRQKFPTTTHADATRAGADHRLGQDAPRAPRQVGPAATPQADDTARGRKTGVGSVFRVFMVTVARSPGRGP